VIDTIFVFLPLVVLASAIAAGLKARPVAAETGLSSGAGEEQPT
jgi:hypothetical protein